MRSNADKCYLALIICYQKSDTYYRKSESYSRTLDICDQINNTCSRKLNRHYLINFTANPDSYICFPKFIIYNRINNTDSLTVFFYLKLTNLRFQLAYPEIYFPNGIFRNTKIIANEQTNVAKTMMGNEMSGCAMVQNILLRKKMPITMM